MEEGVTCGPVCACAYIRVYACDRALPSLKRLGWHPPAFLCGLTWISLVEDLAYVVSERYRYVILLADAMSRRFARVSAECIFL